MTSGMDIALRHLEVLTHARSWRNMHGHLSVIVRYSRIVAEVSPAVHVLRNRGSHLVGSTDVANFRPEARVCNIERLTASRFGSHAEWFWLYTFSSCRLTYCVLRLCMNRGRLCGWYSVHKRPSCNLTRAIDHIHERCYLIAYFSNSASAGSFRQQQCAC